MNNSSVKQYHISLISIKNFYVILYLTIFCILIGHYEVWLYIDIHIMDRLNLFLKDLPLIKDLVKSIKILFFKIKVTLYNFDFEIVHYNSDPPMHMVVTFSKSCT